MLGTRRYRCEACGSEFDRAKMVVGPRGDRRCPRCSSLRVRVAPTRFEIIYNFLFEYNKY